MRFKTDIVVNLQVEGQHEWPSAPQVAPEVSFLQYPHRHIFHIRCQHSVTHSDRDIEIIMWKREIKSYLVKKYFDFHLQMHNFGSLSCEAIALDLAEHFNMTICEVLEDGENGAIVNAVSI